jgi:hypothetical protein
MMMKFSDRTGITKPNEIIQFNGMSIELRNSLWNAFDLCFLEKKTPKIYLMHTLESYLSDLAYNLWAHYFKRPLDRLLLEENMFIEFLREYFFKTEWYNVYNFLEFCLDYTNELEVDKNNYIRLTNNFLQTELSGYRIIGDNFVPITNKEQIKSIENSLDLTNKNKLANVHTHLSASIQLLSSKDIDDSDKYRNTIKETISAVEALCNVLNNTKAKGLDGALKLLKTKIKIHSALEKGFTNLYGYTSDANGIRHTIMDEPDLNLEDAVYMLVTCSAFINYIIIKADKAGLI